MRLLKQLLAVAAVTFVGGQAAAAADGNAPLTLVLGFATAALALFVYTRIVRRTERREVTELARKDAVPATGRGLLIGGAMFGAVIANIAFLGGYHVDGIGSVSGAIGLLGFMAAVAVTEELLFRGVLFRIIEERIGTYLSLTLTGLVFGLMHLVNPTRPCGARSPSPSRRASCSPPPTPPPATCGSRSACTSRGTSPRAASSAPRSPATASPRAC